MATFVEWRSRLRSLFTFSLNIGDDLNIANDFRNIIQVKDGVLYVWSDRDQCILSLRLTQLGRLENAAAAADDDDDYVAAVAASVDADVALIQSLVPSTPPIYAILFLVCNPSGDRIALAGKSGINVVDISRRKSTTTIDEPITNGYLCSSTEIGERFFVCNPNCHVLQVKWHPGSDTSTHLVVLFSNNYLRVYDCRSPSTPVQSCQLGPVPVFRLSPSATNNFATVLGDTAIDFDFGRPVTIGEQFRHNHRIFSSEIDTDELLWPVYLVRGNGDVYTTWAINPRSSYLKSEVRGPLTMHPPAEDNYGVDACSIICLMSTIPILAIATCSGMLYHCVLLDDDTEKPEITKSKLLPAPNCSLYVYESVELGLVLTSAGQLDITIDNNDDYICPIKLYPDPTTNLRYHCCHATGLHTVALPLIPQLEQYANHLGVDDAGDVLSSIENQNCIVEHLICTKPLSNSPMMPIIGLAIAYGHQLGSTTLLCLTSIYHLHTLSLVPTYLDSLPPLLMDDSQVEFIKSEHCRVVKEPFYQYIRQLLQRQITNPLMISHSSLEPTPRECAQVLGRATKILREQYIEKLDLAKAEIQKRIKLLTSLKAHQLNELKRMNQTKENISKTAESLAEKYEDLHEKQEGFIRRTENIIRALNRHSPVMSDAERSMQTELNNLQIKSNHFKKSIEKINEKRRYQSRYYVDVQSESDRNRSSITSETQIKQLKDLMTKESQMLATLKNKMNDLQQRLGI